MTGNPSTILFVCVHNSGRSQMAEAFFNRLSRGLAIGVSAGTRPSDRVNPTVAQAMAEVGMDIFTRQPQLVTQEMLGVAELVITMGCNLEETCPANMVITEDWGLEDPKDKPMAKVRQIRNEVQSKVEALIEHLGIIPQIH